ncbi:Inositol monophosphatase 1 [Lamellibrachia satsuma]|nr:Inositol monophosphatase 1 [Lamellibrachia satsuma]
MSCYLNREINVLTETDYPIADGRRAILPQRRMKTDMSNDDLDVCFKLVQDVARQAGEMIREAFKQEKQVQIKSSMADLVTESDKKVEQLIISTVKDKFPTHSFIGEESAVPGEKCVLTDNATWIIDPIDGTTNFVHRFPYIAVSIALLVQKQTVIALIYNPILDQMYTARPGQGAYCNGVKLQVTQTRDLGQAIVCAEFGSSRDSNVLDSKFRSMRKIIEQAHGLRTLGSAALHMCLCASGNIDAHFTFGIHIWDIAAGYLIVREAGGVVIDTGAMAMSMVASGKADAYYEVGPHCWDFAAGDLLVREAGGTVIDTSGGPLDLMSRRVLCAGTAELAQHIAASLENLDLQRDDCAHLV